MSSACLILIDSRIELTDGSINTRSCSDRVIVSAVNKTSDDVLGEEEERQVRQLVSSAWVEGGDQREMDGGRTVPRPRAHCVARRPTQNTTQASPVSV